VRATERERDAGGYQPFDQFHTDLSDGRGLQRVVLPFLLR
jgi:hypothetical protein